MPTAADYQTPRASSWTAGLLVAAVLVMLFWGLSIAEPCLLGHFVGSGDPSANPIAITECGIKAGRAGITRGDLIIRLGGLALVSGMFACVCSLLDPTRARWNVTAISVGGLTIAAVVHCVLQSLVLGATEALLTFYFVAWVVCCGVASLAAGLGSALAATTAPESRYG